MQEGRGKDVSRRFRFRVRKHAAELTIKSDKHQEICHIYAGGYIAKRSAAQERTKRDMGNRKGKGTGHKQNSARKEQQKNTETQHGGKVEASTNTNVSFYLTPQQGGEVHLAFPTARTLCRSTDHRRGTGKHRRCSLANVSRFRQQFQKQISGQAGLTLGQLPWEGTTSKPLSKTQS